MDLNHLLNKNLEPLGKLTNELRKGQGSRQKTEFNPTRRGGGKNKK